MDKMPIIETQSTVVSPPRFDFTVAGIDRFFWLASKMTNHLKRVKLEPALRWHLSTLQE